MIYDPKQRMATPHMETETNCPSIATCNVILGGIEGTPKGTRRTAFEPARQMQGMKNPDRDARVLSVPPYSILSWSARRLPPRASRPSGFRADDRHQPIERAMAAMADTTRSCSETKAPRPSSPS